MSRKYTSLPYQEFVVADGRFDYTRRPIKYIVLHTMVGSMTSTRNLFASTPPAGKETSAHYGISFEGNIDAYLEETYTAYHCGNYSYNQQSIGIEHEDKGKHTEPRPDALYNTSAKLVADICKYYEIPCNKDHILIHRGVPGSSTACPSALDTDRIIREANKILGGVNNSTGTMTIENQLYELLVKKSTNYDSVVQYLQAGDPKDVMFTDIQKIIAGIKGSVTACQGQLSTSSKQLAETQQEVKNKDLEISRVKDELTKNYTLLQLQLEGLKNQLDQSESTLKESRESFKTVSEEKGEALKRVAALEEEIKSLKNNQVEKKSILEYLLELIFKRK